MRVIRVEKGRQVQAMGKRGGQIACCEGESGSKSRTDSVVANGKISETGQERVLMRLEYQLSGCSAAW